MKVNGQSEGARRSLQAVRMVVDVLASVRFAVAGTILPQAAEAGEHLQQNPGAAEQFAFFGGLGLTHIPRFATREAKL